MSPIAVFVTTAIFWILAILAIFLPPRHAVVAYILLSQFDFGITASYSDSSLGWENALKAVVISTILLLRVRPIDPLPSAFVGVRNLWMFLVGYAGLAVAWSPYRLSAVKMMGYFYAYTILFLIFTVAWRRKWLNSSSLIPVAFLSLLLGTLQTYCLGNPYGDPDYDNRFTSFTGPQSFAPFLLCMIVLLLLCVRRTSGGILAAVCAAVGLILTGSRYNVFGFVWVLLILAIAFTQSQRCEFNLFLIARNIMLGGAVAVLIAWVILSSLPKNRVNELLDVFSTRNASVQDVNTFAWRLVIYAETLKEISERNLLGLLTGSGTSSGAAVGIKVGYFQEATVDPNRIIHDEFLRCLYEWGVIGLLSFVGFLAALFRLSFKLVRLTRSPQAWACLAVIGPLFLGLLIENILGLGDSSAGVGYCLVFSSMIAQLHPAPSKVKVRNRILVYPVEQTG